MIKLIACIFFISAVALFTGGCGVGIATVAGVAAYSVYASGSEADSITKALNKQLNNGYYTVAVLNETVVLAGQVAETSDIQKAKNIVGRENNSYTVYSYLKQAPVESKNQQEGDALINSKVAKLVNNTIKNSGASAVANGEVYLLVDSKQSGDTLNTLSDDILKIQGVKSVVTVQERKPN